MQGILEDKVLTKSKPHPLKIEIQLVSVQFYFLMQYSTLFVGFLDRGKAGNRVDVVWNKLQVSCSDFSHNKEATIGTSKVCRFKKYVFIRIQEYRSQRLVCHLYLLLLQNFSVFLICEARVGCTSIRIARQDCHQSLLDNLVEFIERVFSVNIDQFD